MNELIGAELDKAVSEAIGNPWHKPNHGNCCTCQTCGWDHDNCQCGYSDDWSQAGPLIEEYKIVLVYDYDRSEWEAEMSRSDDETGVFRTGPTPLIAAMRALVASQEIKTI
jgi:hypothetical protein